jgi:trehalose 6-phosphate phosphatase
MPDVDATVALLSDRPRETAILVDYDGSLAPIVDRPQDAVPLPGAVDMLRALVERVGFVGVVSGRPLYFLVEALPVPGLAYTGLYGLEFALDGKREVDPRVLPYLTGVAEAAEAAESRLPGIAIERKAGITVTLHYRHDESRREEVQAVADELAEQYGLDAPQRGRMAVELRPPVPVDKGTVVDELVAGYAVAAFAGDDAGDLPAFDAIAQAVEDDRLEHGVRIGVLSSEAPSELHDRVDTFVDGPEGLVALLRSIAARAGAD